MSTVNKKHWHPEEERDLRMMAKAKIPAKRIARYMRRTEGALRQKALNIGVRFRRAA